MILAVVDLLKVVNPLFDRAWDFVKGNAVNSGRRGSTDSIAGGVLPHSPCVHVAVINISRSVKICKGSLVKAKLGCYLLRPPSFET